MRSLRHPGYSDFAATWAKDFYRTAREEARHGRLDHAAVHRIEQRSDPSHVLGDEAAMFVESFHGDAPLSEAQRWGYRHVLGHAKRAAVGGRLTPEAGLRLPEHLHADFEVITGTSLQPYQGATIATQLARRANGLVYESETEAPYRPFSRNTKKRFELDETSARELLGLAPDHPLTIEPGRDFFSAEARGFQILADEASESWLSKHYERRAGQAWTMQRALNKALVDVRLIDTNPGGDIGEIYLVGRTRNGNVAGLQSHYA